MLCRTILTLLIAFVGISRIEAREIGERTAQLNKTPVVGVNTAIEALTVQNDNTFNTGPNDQSIYGSVVKVDNNIYESPNSRQPTSTQTRTVVAPGGPGHDGVFYAKSEERDQQGEPKNNVSATTYMKGNTFNLAPDSKNVFGSYIEQNNNVYRLRGGNNQTQPNEEHKSSNRGNIGLTAETILTNSVFQTSGNMEINAGSSITRNGNVYTSNKNSQTGEKTINGTERQDNLSDIMTVLLKDIQTREKIYKDGRINYTSGTNRISNKTQLKVNQIHHLFFMILTRIQKRKRMQKTPRRKKHPPRSTTDLTDNRVCHLMYITYLHIF
ncbi:P325 [Bracoviriform indiense]|uniref:p325 n=1 Tax=Bracoviriform indiense TaxID=116759 RepID=Q7T840_9VIRU|nr:P325 [Bracoviriform indiense]AAP87441.1 P325 [Bracoviriform indiense]